MVFWLRRSSHLEKVWMDSTLGEDAATTAREVPRATKESEMTDWMNEEYGIPHKDGKVRWYVVGFQEDMFEYLGWFDMTDWDTGFEEVLTSARLLKFVVDADEDYRILRHDQLLELKNNVDWALQEAMEVEGERTFSWWYEKNKLTEKDA